MKMVLVLLTGLAALVPGRVNAADEFSGADKLRSLYSAEFRFAADGLPLVPVAIVEGVTAVSLSCAGGLRVLPEERGGPELRTDDSWRVTARDTRGAQLRHWAIVWRGRPADGGTAMEQVKLWKERGENARSFERGTLFGVSGEVWDRREVLVAVGPTGSPAEAEAVLDRLSRKAALVGPGLFTEMLDRPHGELEATGSKSGARLKNEGVIWFAPIGDGPTKVAWTGSGARSSGNGSYWGRIYVTIDRRGGIAVVNALPEDRLLDGLVPAEIFPGAPDEALKAQAVAARGELLTKIGTRHVGDPFRLCSETHCQVYSGAGRETPRTTAAVKATRGEVLFAAGGKDLVDTVYSANCGGHTENNENVWPDQPAQNSLRGRFDGPDSVDDPLGGGGAEPAVAQFVDKPVGSWCGRATLGGADRFRWSVVRTAAELEHLLAPLGTGAVKNIEVTDRGVSGRAKAIRVVGASRTVVVKGELKIRQTFGGLRSSLFVVEVKSGAATFQGAGFGHGVGLCQTGSVGMAQAGKTYRYILKHYYQGSVLRKLW